jgi:hypothetical protein
VSGKSSGNPFLFIMSSMNPRSRSVLSDGERPFGLYTRSIIVPNSSDASSTDMPSLANKIAIKLWSISIVKRLAKMAKTYPPVPLPPIRSKYLQGSIPPFDSSDSLSKFNRCIMFLIISNWENPRMPPPSNRAQILAIHTSQRTGSYQN